MIFFVSDLILTKLDNTSEESESMWHTNYCLEYSLSVYDLHPGDSEKPFTPL